MELYAQNYDSSEYPYWDSFDANDTLPVMEVSVMDMENGEECKADFDKLFPNEIPDLTIDSEESFEDALEQAVENPYHFKDIIQKATCLNKPEMKAAYFERLLVHMTAVVVPEILPDNLLKILTEIVALMSENMMDPSHILSTASHLNRLGLADVSSQLVQRSYTEGSGSLQDFLGVVENWKCFWYMDANSVLMFLQQLSLAVSSPVPITDDNLVVGQRQTYLRHFCLLHVLALNGEIDQIREKITKTTTDTSPKESQTSISFLKIATTDTDDSGDISFYRTCTLEQNLRITRGQYVGIQRQNSRSLPLFTGQVHAIRLAPFHMTLKVEGRIPESVLSAMRKDGVRYFRADLIGNIVTYQRVIAAMRQLEKIDCDKPVFDCIVGTFNLSKRDDSDFTENVETVESITVQHDRDFEELNIKQRDAVLTSLENNICLIQGPPGTGKTKVACHIVKEIVSSKKYTGVLVVGETNIAVDNLARRLRNELQIVRIGTGEGVAADMYDITLEAQARRLAVKEAKRSTVKQHGETHRNMKFIKRVLAAADVVLATCAGSGDVVLESCQFDIVLVDEATLTMETTLLCALVHNVKHLVLIGDHKQLGPVIQDSASANDLDLPSPKELTKTLFHRLVELPSVPSCFLETQHRMHPEIMAFPSAQFYDNRLISGDCVRNRPEIKFPWPQMNPYKPVCFVNVEHRQSKRGTSYYNTKEAEVVKTVVDVLLRVDEEAHREHRLGVNQIAVLTLYQAQVAELKSKIKHGIAISSVDGFQGQEKEVIIASTVRCNDRRDVGFAGDLQRINVLLTRAKRGLIIVGNAETLKGSDIWSRWLQQAPFLQECDIKPLDPNKEKKKPGNGPEKGPKRPYGRGKPRMENRK